MPSLNRILLLGTLIRPPTFHRIARGTPVCTFDLRVDMADREIACVIRVVIWGQPPEPADLKPAKSCKPSRLCPVLPAVPDAAEDAACR